MSDGAPGLGLGVWGETIDEMCDASAAAEQLGLDSVWSTELHRSPFVPLAAIAIRTERVRIASGVALAFVRSPMAIAQAVLDLDDLSDGRVILGLGSGVRRLNEDWHNRSFEHPALHIRETVVAVRRIVAESHLGRPIEQDGELEPLRIRGYTRPFAPRRTVVPIYLGGVGPLMLRLAGSLADGWISHELCSPAYLRSWALPQIEEGLRRSGRSRPDLEIVASACCVVDRDGRAARRIAAGVVAFYATVRTYNEFFRFHGFLAEAEEIQRRFRAGDEQGAIEACPDEMVDAMAFAGTPDEVRRRLRSYDGLADVVKLSPPTHFVAPEATRASQAAILELIS